jgi:hypothetical protein
MKAYAIARGEYSDYGITTICSTREIAEKTMALLMASIEVKMPTKAEIPIAIMEAVMIARVLCDLRDENP